MSSRDPTFPARRRAVLATLGSGTDILARQGAQFVVLLVLARLLTPQDFGTVALLSVFVALGVVVADAGLTTAVLQTPAMDDGHLDSALWTSVVFGAAVTTLGIGIARVLTWLFERPELFSVSAAMTLAIVATAIGQVPAALLVRERAFGRLLIAGLVGVTVSGAVAVWMAANGAGIWALAVQSVLLPSVASVMVFVVGHRSFLLHWNGTECAHLLRRGRWVLAANVVDTGFARFQVLVVGAAFGTSSLGYYQRADSTQQLAAETTSTVVGRVALPLFARSSARPDLMRAGFLTGIRSVTAINAPLMAILSALASPALLALFGPQWGSSAPILTILCAAGLLWPLHVLAVNLLYATEGNQEVFRIDLVKKGVGLALLAVGLLGGLRGVALAQVGLGLVALAVNGRSVRRLVAVGVVDQVREVAPATLLALCVGTGTAFVSRVWDTGPWRECIVLGTAAMLAYLLLALAFRVRAVTELLGSMRPGRTSGVSGSGA